MRFDLDCGSPARLELGVRVSARTGRFAAGPPDEAAGLSQGLATKVVALRMGGRSAAQPIDGATAVLHCRSSEATHMQLGGILTASVTGTHANHPVAGVQAMVEQAMDAMPSADTLPVLAAARLPHPHSRRQTVLSCRPAAGLHQGGRWQRHQWLWRSLPRQRMPIPTGSRNQLHPTSRSSSAQPPPRCLRCLATCRTRP